MTDTMVRYRYEGETVEGETVKGEIKAPSSLAARNERSSIGTRTGPCSRCCGGAVDTS